MIFYGDDKIDLLWKYEIFESICLEEIFKNLRSFDRRNHHSMET